MADDLNLTQKYLDAINEAISVHTKNAVQGLAFNKTETATIVGEQDADGFYPVYNGSVRYMAKSEKTNYRKGSTVYVTIPNNDTSQEKYIVGMLRDKDGKGLTYVSPLQKYAPDEKLGNFLEKEEWKIDQNDDFWTSLLQSNGATNQLNYNNTEGTGLVANFNLQKNSQGPEYVFLYQSKNLQECKDINEKNFKYMGVSVDFKTLLSAYHVIKGDYGIQIFIQYSYNQENRESEKVYKVSTYRLSTRDMVGAVYNFNTYYKQEALFEIDNDIEAGTKIHRIGIMFYQDGNFINSDGHIDTKYNINKLKNILLRNLSIEFGDDLPEDVIDEVKIYTTNGQYYDSAQLNEQLNEKRIQLKWRHLDYDNAEDEDEPGKLVEVTSATSKISSETDVNLYPKITWYKDSLHTLADFRAEEAAAAAENDALYALLEKYKASMSARDAFLDVWKQEYDRIVGEESLETIEQRALEQHYAAIRDASGQAYEYHPDAITRDEMYDLINELNLNPSKDYFYNMETQQYYLTPSGEDIVDRTITRNAKEALSPAASSEDGGDHWVPIAVNTLKVDFTPEEELKRNDFSIKCIVEYGPRDNNGNIIKESDHYRKIVSNIITFINLTAVPDPNTQDAAIGVKITYDDESNGQYPLYDGQTGKILDNFDSSEERTLTMDFVSKYSGKSYLNGNESIIWEVPKTNTMIDPSGYVNLKATKDSPENVDGVTTRYILGDAEGKELAKKYYINYDPVNYYYIKLDCYNSNKVKIYARLHYQIKEYYVQSAISNTVTCHLIKNQQIYTGTTTMLFSHKGTNGTDYTFTLGLGKLVDVDHDWEEKGPADSALTIGEQYWRLINFDLFDADCKQINLTDQQKNDIIKLWVEHKEDGFYTSNVGNALDIREKRNRQGLYTQVAIKVKNNYTSITEDLKYIVLQASLKSNATSTYNNRIYNLDNILFTQFLQIPVKTQQKYYLNGSGIIFYDDDGAIDNGTNSPKYALKNRTGAQRLVIRANGVEITPSTANAQYYPSFTAEWELEPTSIFFSNIAYESQFSKKASKLAIDCYDGTSLVYTVPLLILQNKYQIPALNRWNGKLLVDSDNNQIMAATISAGHKEQNNSFTGIIMGDIRKKDGQREAYTPISGLFGYNTGAQSFGFQTDGTGFIGKSGTGRIEFNGEKGWIQSGNYSASENAVNRSGTRIDLDDGSIDMWGRGVTYTYNSEKNRYETSNTGVGDVSTNIHLDTAGTASKPYFKIEVPRYYTTNNSGTVSSSQTSNPSYDRISLMQIDQSNFYLQTADYDESRNTGLKIDLKRGIFDSKGKLTINGALGSEINFGSGDDYIKMGIYGNGTSYLTATGTLNITGDENSSINFGDVFTVNRNGGTIGGWTINSSSLSGGEVTLNSEGSLYGPTWGINADGSAYFKNVAISDQSTFDLGSPGWNGQGIIWNGTGLSLGGDIYANSIHLNDAVYVNEQRFPPTEVTYVTGGSISVEETHNNVVTSITSGTNGIYYYKSSIPSIKSIKLTLTRQKSYVLGSSTTTDATSSSDGLGVWEGGKGETVDLSGQLVTLTKFNGHKHSSGSYTTYGHSHGVSVNTLTGEGSTDRADGMDIHGMSGTPD